MLHVGVLDLEVALPVGLEMAHRHVELYAGMLALELAMFVGEHSGACFLLLSLLTPMHDLQGDVRACLRLPPWRLSWTSGIPWEFESAFIAVENIALSVVRAHIETEREVMTVACGLHISWN